MFSKVCVGRQLVNSNVQRYLMTRSEGNVCKGECKLTIGLQFNIFSV